MTKQPRIIHCSYCLEEGHRINRCIDPTILFAHEHLSETAAIDWKMGFESHYLTHELNKLLEPELHMLGYKHSIHNVTKLNNEMLVSQLVDVYYANSNTHEYLIKNMNMDELEYFTNKLYEYAISADEILNKPSLSEIHSKFHMKPSSKQIVECIADKSLNNEYIQDDQDDTILFHGLLDIKNMEDEVLALIYSSIVCLIAGTILYVQQQLYTNVM